jgi:hypothetical protein
LILGSWGATRAVSAAVTAGHTPGAPVEGVGDG